MSNVTLNITHPLTTEESFFHVIGKILNGEHFVVTYIKQCNQQSHLLAVFGHKIINNIGRKESVKFLKGKVALNCS